MLIATMRAGLRRHVTFANVVSLLALFVALGGSSYAALKLPKNSVGARQIRSNAVSSPKVADGSLLAQDFKAGQLPAGAKGEKGDQGSQGVQGVAGAPGTAKGYARVNPATVGPTPLPNPPRSKGVNGIVQPDLGAVGPDVPDYKFCFDLTFTPEVAVGSANITNNANVTATVPGDYSPPTQVQDSSCPVGYRDAVVGTYAANTSTQYDQATFSVIFE